jgi:arylsulfatase
VDVLPTLADLAGAKVPDTWPGREPTPLAGISLKPVLNGGKITERPPIHLLFGKDRGLRDGDWKLVSFQSQRWELYHISRDRTELHDLAAEHPDRVERMSKQWHEMTEKVLMAPKSECKPVDDTPTPKFHREWTKFDKPLFPRPTKP